MSTSAMNEQSGNFWNKFKTSTKTLSTSFSHLSVKSETDGDSPNYTVVHKALVKFYKEQEPFTGFPGWLGHKEDLPDEQKILRKQTTQLEKHHQIASSTSGLAGIRNDMSSGAPAQPGHELQKHSLSYKRRTKASQTFHNIYSNGSESNPTQQPQEQSSAGPDVANRVPTRTSSNRINLIGRPTWSSNVPPASMLSSNNENARPELTSQSSQLMADRLRRKTTSPF